MNEERVELVDLGDAMEETRQPFWYPRYPDSEFGFGWLPN